MNTKLKIDKKQWVVFGIGVSGIVSLVLYFYVRSIFFPDWQLRIGDMTIGWPAEIYILYSIIVLAILVSSFIVPRRFRLLYLG